MPTSNTKSRPLTAEIAAVKRLLAGYEALELAVVFGSHASATPRPDSDLDIAISFGRALTAEERIRIIEDLAVATGRAIDLVDLTRAGEPLLGQIVTRGRLILGEPAAFARLLARHLVDEADFLPIRDRILRERRDAWIAE